MERQDCNFDIPDVSKTQQNNGVDMCKIIILVKELDLKKMLFCSTHLTEKVWHQICIEESS